MNSSNSKVGIFDSGVGGLSVWREAIKLMPGQKFIYIADSAHCPYGPKSVEYIIDRARVITEKLISLGASIIVVACNTATSAAIEHLRREYSIPFIGMEPAVKPAALLTKTGVIGVLATKGTLSGERYHSSVCKYASNVHVVERVGTGLVDLVERGVVEGQEPYNLLLKYLTPMVEEGADQIVLGCTHYPFLKDVISKIVGSSVSIVDPSPAVARQLYVKANERGIYSNRFKDVGVDLYRLCYCDTDFISTSSSVSSLKILSRSVIPNIPDDCYFTI